MVEKLVFKAQQAEKHSLAMPLARYVALRDTRR